MPATSRTPTPNIFPTLLDPPESTQHRFPAGAAVPAPGCEPSDASGGFRLIPEVNRPRTQSPGIDPKLPDPLLHPLSVRSASSSNALAGIHFRHHTWSADRNRVLEALRPVDPDPHAWIRYEDDPSLPDLAPVPSETDRSDRFANCGTRSVVLQSADDPSRYKVASERCHDRFCLPCMQDRARLIVANLQSQLEYKPTRFLTLTLKHTDSPLTEQIDRLYNSFRCLRRRDFWQDTVTGGVAFLELKLSSHDGCWHPHLHILIRGCYVPKELVADAWLQITGDSFIIDIRMVKSPEHLYSYLTRYVTKGWGPGIYRKLHALREAVQAMAGRKLLSSFGEFSKLRLLKPPDTETWNELGTLQEIITLAAQRVAWAMTACAVIFSPTWEPPTCVEPPDE